MTYAHHAMYQIDDFERQCHQCHLNHQQPESVPADYGDYKGCSHDYYKYGVGEFGAKFGHTPNFAYDSSDPFFFLLELLQLSFKIINFVLMVFWFLVHTDSFRQEDSSSVLRLAIVN
jgi:hypothetical protein